MGAVETFMMDCDGRSNVGTRFWMQSNVVNVTHEIRLVLDAGVGGDGGPKHTANCPCRLAGVASGECSCGAAWTFHAKTPVVTKCIGQARSC